MPQSRPASVLVIAIFHFIVGGLGLVCGICGGVQMAAGGQLGGFAGAQDPKQKQLQVDLEKQLNEKLPHNKLITGMNLGIGFVFSAVLIAAGFGLLNMQAWGRLLSLAYAGLSLMHKVFMAIYNLAFALPATREVFKVLKANLGPQERQAAPMFDFIETFATIGVTVDPFIRMVYPVAVLIIMLLPSVAAAFRNDARLEDYDAGRDRYDDLDR